MAKATPGYGESPDGLCAFPDCETPQTDMLSLPLCNRHILKVHRDAKLLCKEYLPEVSPAEVRAKRRPQASTPGAIYFIRLGQLVKIGFTTNLPQRLKALPHEEVMAVTTGTMRDEKALHRRFAHLRQSGEWFNIAADLTEHIDALNKAA